MMTRAVPTAERRDALSVLAAASDEPNRVALVVGDREFSFRELGERVERAMEWLIREANADPVQPRVSSDDPRRPVALIGQSDLGTLVILYALIEMGRPAALIHPRLTERERAPVVALVAPEIVLGDDAPARLDAFTPQRQPSSETKELPSERAARVLDPESCLAVLFTSGTTGEPKGVMLSRRAFEASARASEQNLGFYEDDRWLLGLPIAHVGGLSILTRCLIARRTVVVPPEVAAGQRLSAAGLVRVIQDARVTLLSLVPTQLEWLLAHEPPFTPPPRLRAVLLGGAAARASLLERAGSRGVPVLTTYGLTEACSQVTTETHGTKKPDSSHDRGSGAPMVGTDVRVVGGVIAVRGPTLFSGYVTRRNGVSHPLDADGFFQTDDLGRLDANGRLHVVGRRSDTIITGGENVYPAEVEAILETCPGVAAACVFGVPDDTWGQIVAVAIVPSEAGFLRSRFEAFVAANLASHRRPRQMVLATALAVTPAGKLDRRETARSTEARLRPFPLV
ncbi:MAG TPA: AMP-binding protein [Polyangiaceae bacterium]